MSISDLRSFRIKLSKTDRGIAIFDLVLAFVGTYLLTFILPSKYTKNKVLYYSSVIPIGIIFHVLFNVDSFLTNKLFNSEINMYKVLAILNILIVTKEK